MEDVLTNEETSSCPNDVNDIASHFSWLHTRLDTVDDWMMSYGGKIIVLGDRMSSIDDLLLRME